MLILSVKLGYNIIVNYSGVICGMDEKNKYSKYLNDTAEFNECEDDFCDLDNKKICDNCGKCLEEGRNYKIIKITKILTEDKK